MALSVNTQDFDHPTDISRAQEIVDSPGMGDVDGKLGAPFTLREVWPSIISRGSLDDCGTRKFCYGCDRITRSALGLVYTVLTENGDRAVGAVCSSSIESAPFFPVFFTRSVDKPKL